MPYTQVANLDFEDIKIALKDYLRAQTEFTDYDNNGYRVEVFYTIVGRDDQPVGIQFFLERTR